VTKTTPRPFTATILLVLFSAGHVAGQSKEIPAYKCAENTVEERVADLLARMTLPEKVDLVGGDGFKTKKNAHFGIPELVM
jgi:hypothetical protein